MTASDLRQRSVGDGDGDLTVRGRRWRWRWRNLLAVGSGVFVLLVAAVIGLRVYNAFALLASGEKVDLGGGREMFVACEGSGSPTILLEHGLGSSGAEWQEVQDRLAETNRVCWRSRAGQGFSDPHPGEGSRDERTRTAADSADELALLLATADIRGPYVMVGHSFGGYVVRLFTDRQPDVVGMVLVDSMHEDQIRLLRQTLRPEAWDEVGGLLGTANPEGLDVTASADQVAATGDLGNLPLVVLEAGQQASNAADAGISETTATEIDAAMAEQWPRFQADLARLSSDASHRRVDASGHFIQIDDPGAVVDAVRLISER